jgi:adenosylhomocysteine nucleosidase
MFPEHADKLTAAATLEWFNASDIKGATVIGYGTPLPTPADAKTYGYGPTTTTKSWVFIGAYAAPRQLVGVARKATGLLGKTTIADATGNPKRIGTITNKIVAGVVGQADYWTEPLPWIESQNMLYQTDAEENEASGFAFANAQMGVPWLLVRGISDTVLYPNAYDAIVSSRRDRRPLSRGAPAAGDRQGTHHDFRPVADRECVPGPTT